MSAPKLEPPPATPATEWADQAHAALAPAVTVDVTVDTVAFDTSSQPPLMTPGLDIPGAFPGDDDSIYPQATARPGLGRVNSGGGKDAIHTSGYIAPERLDQVEHLVEGVGHTAARFVPTGVASAVSSYWYGSRTASPPPAETNSEQPAGKPQPGVGNGAIPGSYNAADSREADSPAVENEHNAALPPTPAPVAPVAPVPQEAPKVMEAPAVDSTQKAEVAPADIVAPSTPEPPVLVAAPAPVAEEKPAPAPAPTPAPAPAPVAEVAEEKEDKNAAAVEAPPAPAEEKHEKEEAAAGLGMAGVGAGVAAYAAAKGENEKPAVVDDGLAKEKGQAAEGEKEKERAVETPAATPAPAPAPVPAAAKVPSSPPSTPRKAGDPGYHPAVLHPMTPSTKAAAANGSAPAANHERPTSPFGSLSKKGGHGRAASGSVSSSKHNRAASVSSTASGRKKVGFFDKVRGEAKIVMGKIEHKKDKVEAGRRILHGED
jgi:hypothetical protein